MQLPAECHVAKVIAQEKRAQQLAELIGGPRHRVALCGTAEPLQRDHRTDAAGLNRGDEPQQLVPAVGIAFSETSWATTGARSSEAAIPRGKYTLRSAKLRRRGHRSKPSSFGTAIPTLVSVCVDRESQQSAIVSVFVMPQYASSSCGTIATTPFASRSVPHAISATYSETSSFASRATRQQRFAEAGMNVHLDEQIG